VVAFPMVNNRLRLETAAARSLKRKLIACAALAALACIGATSDPSVSLGATTPLKIMPLGDSITDGYNIPGGYRIDLEDDLAARGISFDFVGSLSNGPTSLEDRNHEGHSGWRIDELRAYIDGWIAASQPDVVLLLIGSNDVAQNFQVATAPERLAGLIDRIHELRPATKIFVSSIPMSTNTAYHSAAQAYNAEIPGIVGARSAVGRPIWFVNGGGSLTLADMAEGSHPNASGYSKLADAWLAALVPTLALPR
jgi:lysophospholipase L1-like esterase